MHPQTGRIEKTPSTVRKSSVVTPAAVERALKKSLTAIEKQSRDPGPVGDDGPRSGAAQL